MPNNFQNSSTVNQEQKEPPRTSGPADADKLERQINALFGVSVFGEWIQPSAVFTFKEVQPQARRYSLRMSWPIAAGLAVLGAVIAWTIFAGLARIRSQQRARTAGEIAEFLKSGDLPRVDRILPELEAASGKWDPADPHMDLISRAEATLFRHYDADPRRLKWRAPVIGLESRSESYHLVVAEALFASRVERLARLNQLQRVDHPKVRDPQAAFLIATALERADDLNGATRAYMRAVDLGPDYLYNLAELARFYQRLGNANASLTIIGRMTDEDPRSPWTALAEDGHAFAFDGLARRPAPIAAEPAVAASQRQFIRAVAALKRGDAEIARRSLQRAVDLVRNQAPLLLDYIDLLIESGYPAAARDLLKQMAGPASVAATAARGRVLLVEGRTSEAVSLLQKAWSQGFRDPRAAMDLVRALQKLNAPDTRASHILTELIQLWPDNLRLEVEYARYLVEHGQASAGAERIRARFREIGQYPCGRTRSSAYLILAQYERDQGNARQALALARQSVKSDPANQEATALLQQRDSAARDSAARKSHARGHSRRFPGSHERR